MAPAPFVNQDYLHQRLLIQQRWYETQANRHKRLFMELQTGVLALSLSIPLLLIGEPVLTTLGNGLLHQLLPQVPGLSNWATPLSALLSALIALLTGLEKLHQPQVHWFNYRLNEEWLKKEAWLYRCQIGAYQGLTAVQAEQRLVNRVENLIAADVSRFKQGEYSPPSTHPISSPKE